MAHTYSAHTLPHLQTWTLAHTCPSCTRILPAPSSSSTSLPTSRHSLRPGTHPATSLAQSASLCRSSGALRASALPLSILQDPLTCSLWCPGGQGVLHLRLPPLYARQPLSPAKGSGLVPPCLVITYPGKKSLVVVTWPQFPPGTSGHSSLEQVGWKDHRVSPAR